MNDTAPNGDLKIEVHEEPAWRRVIDVEVGTAEVEKAYTEALRTIQKKAKVPGFRPGKVPRSILQQRFGPDLEHEILGILVPRSLTQAYRDHDLAPISDPQLSNMSLKEGEPFRYRATVDIRPKVTPDHYEGLVLQKKTRSVTGDQVEETIQKIRERRADYQPSEDPSKRGDTVVCDMAETTADRTEAERQTMVDISLELNPERVFPEFANGLLGVKPGETRNITLTYPEEYSNTSLAGKKVEFEVSVKEVRVRRLPELDEAFFKALAGDISTLDDLRTRVREDLEAQNDQEADRELNNEIITQVLAKNVFDVPVSLISDYLSRLEEDIKKSQPDITTEQVEAQYKEMGIRQVQWEFLFHAIADKENVTVTDADLEGWLQGFANAQGLDMEEARKQLAGSGQVARIKDNMLETKVFSFLRERSTVTELPVSGGIIVKPGEGT